MIRTIDTSGGPVEIESNGGGIKVERDWGNVRTLYVFPNGMLACLDEAGKQMPTIQRPLIEAMDRLFELECEAE